MSDIALLWNPAKGSADFRFVSGDFVGENGLRTAVLLSLFTDRRADADENLSDPRGWWADALPVVAGDLFGSHLWLLARRKKTPDVLPEAESDSVIALRWMIDDKVVKGVSVVANFLPGKLQGFELDVSLTKPSGNLVNFKFSHAWAAEGSR